MDVDGNTFRGNFKRSTPTTAPPKTSWQKVEEKAESLGYTAGVAYSTKALWMPVMGGIAGGLMGGFPGAEAGFYTGLEYGLA